jgi:hypothetical protein
LTSQAGLEKQITRSAAVARYGQLRLYAALFLVQTAGFAILLWEGVPIYRLISAGVEGQHAKVRTLIVASLAIALMQSAYWTRIAVVPELRVARNAFLGHLAMFFGRISFIFGAAFFTLVIYVRFPELELSIPRLAVLAASLFSIFCYSLELERLGAALNGRHTN